MSKIFKTLLLAVLLGASTAGFTAGDAKAFWWPWRSWDGPWGGPWGGGPWGGYPYYGGYPGYWGGYPYYGYGGYPGYWGGYSYYGYGGYPGYWASPWTYSTPAAPAAPEKSETKK